MAFCNMSTIAFDTYSTFSCKYLSKMLNSRPLFACFHPAVKGCGPLAVCEAAAAHRSRCHCSVLVQPLRLSAHICADITRSFCRIHFTVTSVQRRRIKGKNPNAYTTFCRVLIYCSWCNIRAERHIVFQ